MLFAPVLILLVLPVLIDKFSRRGTVVTDETRDLSPEGT
jgi:hypothetical protein